MFHFVHQKVQFIVAECSTLAVNFSVLGSDTGLFWINALPGDWSPSMTIAEHLSSSHAALICVLIAKLQLQIQTILSLVGPCSSRHPKPRDTLHFEWGTSSSPQILQESVKADEGEPVSWEVFGHNRSKNYTKYDN